MKAVVLRAALLAAVVSAPAFAEEGDKPVGERFALLVGVQKYNARTELNALKYAEDDVTALAKVLEEGGYKKQNIMLMTQKRGGEEGRAMPETARIRQEMELLLKGRTKDDVVVLMFSGHGVQLQGSNDSFFCPMDAKLDDRKTLINLQEVYAALEKCEAGLKVLFVDASRNDPRSANTRPRGVVDLEAVTRPKKEAPSGGVAAFFSCSPGEQAFEDDDLKHGVFSYHLIEGLRGAAAQPGTGDVYLEDLEYYVKGKVERFVRVQFAQRQQPQFVSKLSGQQSPLVSRPKSPENSPKSKE